MGKREQKVAVHIFQRHHNIRHHIQAQFVRHAFGLFVGVNNHFQNVMLVRVLVHDEPAKSFEWGFSKFLRMMGSTAPMVEVYEATI